MHYQKEQVGEEDNPSRQPKTAFFSIFAHLFLLADNAKTAFFSIFAHLFLLADNAICEVYIGLRRLISKIKIPVQELGGQKREGAYFGRIWYIYCVKFAGNIPFTCHDDLFFAMENTCTNSS